MNTLELPHDSSVERAIFSKILLSDTDEITNIIDTISATDFYTESHQSIWQCMVSLFTEGQSIDLPNLRIKLKKEIPNYQSALEVLGESLGEYVFTQELATLINEVKNKSLLRQIVRATKAHTYSAQLENASAVTLLNDIETDTLSLLDKTVDLKPVDAEGIINEVRKDIAKGIKEGWKGYKTGFKELDKATGGLIPSQVWIIGAYTGVGKCLKKGTEVLLYSGQSKKVEDIQVGEEVMGVDSTPRKVLTLGNGIEEMFTITPVKGDPFTVNKSHILSLKRTGTKGERKGKIINISVKDYLEKGKTFKHLYKLYRVPVQFKKKPVPLSPYLLGYWLGNGCHLNTTISINNKHTTILSYLQKEAIKNLQSTVKIKKETNGGMDISLCGSKQNNGSFIKKLRALSILKNKHVPDIYKYNHRNVRLQLLAGLLDSDGSINRSGFEFSNTNEKLIDAVVFIARSVGLAAYKKSRITKGYGKICNSYRVTISGDCSIIPTKHKKAPKRRQKKDVLVTGFSIASIGAGEYVGFTLDKDGLYLLSDFTVTHNTFFLLQMLLTILEQGGRVALFSTEMDRKLNMMRMIGNLADLGTIQMMRNELVDYQIEAMEKAQQTLAKYKKNLIIYDNVYHVEEIRLKTKKLQITNGLDVVAVDYIQNLKGGSTIYERMSMVSTELYRMNQELQITLLLGSQVSQASAGWTSKEAIEFKGAGEIATVADVALWIRKVEGDKNAREILLRKVRHGEALGIKTEIKFPAGRFIDLQMDSKDETTANVKGQLENL